MPKPVFVADVLHLVDHPAEEAAGTASLPVHRGDLLEWRLVRVAVGDAWDDPGSDAGERSLLVLEGVATVKVADWRQSLGSGHLLVARPGASLTVDNDGEGPFVALLGATGSAQTEA